MKKKRVLLSCLLYPVAVSRYLAWGFEAAGCEVITAGLSTGRFIPWGGQQGMNLPEEYVWTPDIPLDMRQQPTVKDVLAQPVAHDIDLVVSCDPHFVLQGESPVPLVCFAVDNHVRDYDARSYDLIFGAHSWARRSKESIFRWLPCAYAPRWHSDLGIERDVEVGFVGVLYDNRMKAAYTLLQNGISMILAMGPAYDESNQLYNRCQSALCISFCGDLACRVFENMAQGCLVLMEKNIIDAGLMELVDGEHYLGFSNDRELLDVVQKARSEAERERIVKAAKKWVRPHTWEARANMILREVFGTGWKGEPDAA